MALPLAAIKRRKWDMELGASTVAKGWRIYARLAAVCSDLQRSASWLGWKISVYASHDILCV